MTSISTKAKGLNIVKEEMREVERVRVKRVQKEAIN